MLVALRAVTVQFGGIVALRNVDLELRAGEVLAVIGPNGAGKSTLLNVVSGLTRRSAGGLEVLDRDAGRAVPADIARRGVGRSFQEPRLIDTATVAENLLCGAHAAAHHYTALDQVIRPWRAARWEALASADIMRVLELLGLGGSARKPVAALPYGARKLIDVGRALMSAPRVVLLDEPTSGLDADERLAVQELIGVLGGDPALGILVVEHHMDVVRAVADRVVGLEGGEVVAVGTPDEVLGSAAFREAVTGTSRRDSCAAGEAQA